MEAMQKSLSALSVVDIEEVLAAGRRHETCAYYGARAFASSSANILALPYSMLLSRQTRKALEIDLRGSLVIFDEGHNIVDAVNELHSCSVALQGLVLLTGALRRYLAKFERRFAPANLILLQQLQQVLLRVSETLSRQEGDRKWGVNEFIADCKVDHINMLKIVDYIRDSHLSPKLASYFEDCNGVVGASQEGGGPPVAAVPNQTQLLSRFAEMMVSFIAADSDGRLFFTKASGLLRYVALNPAKAMDDITAAAHCVILAGGTMRPVGLVCLACVLISCRLTTSSCNYFPSSEIKWYPLVAAISLEWRRIFLVLSWERGLVGGHCDLCTPLVMTSLFAANSARSSPMCAMSCQTGPSASLPLTGLWTIFLPIGPLVRPLRPRKR